jgi:hypothetical protein
MKKAILTVHFHLLKDLLKLPPGIEIERFIPYDESTYMSDRINIILSGDKLPYDVLSGHKIPMVNISYKKGKKYSEVLP